MENKTYPKAHWQHYIGHDVDFAEPCDLCQACDPYASNPDDAYPIVVQLVDVEGGTTCPIAGWACEKCAWDYQGSLIEVMQERGLVSPGKVWDPAVGFVARGAV